MIMLSLILLSCNNNKESKQQFYPIRLFLEQELALIDSFHLPIKRYHIDKNETDSSNIKTTEFRGIVNELLLNSLSSTDALNNYEETTINDLNLDFITLSYTTTEKNITKIELHIDPRSEKVKSIYAEKTDTKKDSLFIRKILWTSGSQLIVNSITKANGTITTHSERYNWSLNIPK